FSTSAPRAPEKRMRGPAARLAREMAEVQLAAMDARDGGGGEGERHHDRAQRGEPVEREGSRIPLPRVHGRAHSPAERREREEIVVQEEALQGAQRTRPG